MNSEIFNEIVKVIAPFAKNQEMLKSVTSATNIHKDLQVNSTRFVDIVLLMEDKFELQISDDDADKIQTVGDCVSLIERLKK